MKIEGIQALFIPNGWIPVPPGFIRVNRSCENKKHKTPNANSKRLWTHCAEMDQVEQDWNPRNLFFNPGGNDVRYKNLYYYDN